MTLFFASLVGQPLYFLRVKLHIIRSKDETNVLEFRRSFAGLAASKRLSGELPFSDPDGLIT
jgi:hypothetical protein